jgi:hypothetical protein
MNIVITPLRDAKQEAFAAMNTACRGHLRARAIAGELLSNAFFGRAASDVAEVVKAEADKYGALWFCQHVHGVELGELIETGVIGYCLYMAYDAIVEVQHDLDKAGSG